MFFNVLLQTLTVSGSAMKVIRQTTLLCVCVDMDRHTYQYTPFMKSSAPLGHSLLSHLLLFDSIACACLFPMENISTYCRPLNSLYRRTDAPSAKPELLRCLQCPSESQNEVPLTIYHARTSLNNNTFCRRGLKKLF